jgi:hypothetical protein
VLPLQPFNHPQAPLHIKSFRSPFNKKFHLQELTKPNLLVTAFGIDSNNYSKSKNAWTVDSFVDQKVDMGLFGLPCY